MYVFSQIEALKLTDEICVDTFLNNINSEVSKINQWEEISNIKAKHGKISNLWIQENPDRQNERTLILKLGKVELTFYLEAFSRFRSGFRFSSQESQLVITKHDRDDRYSWIISKAMVNRGLLDFCKIEDDIFYSDEMTFNLYICLKSFSLRKYLKYPLKSTFLRCFQTLKKFNSENKIRASPSQFLFPEDSVENITPLVNPSIVANVLRETENVFNTSFNLENFNKEI